MSINGVQEARKELRTCLQIERQKLVKELRVRTREMNVRITCAQGHWNTKYNDRRDYHWIKFRFEGKEYWITLFYNEIDGRTGNFHTQIGRIQFWKNITGKTPNEKINDGKWCIQKENSGEPSGGPTYIGAKGYDHEVVVNDFLKFIDADNIKGENGGNSK